MAKFRGGGEQSSTGWRRPITFTVGSGARTSSRMAERLAKSDTEKERSDFGSESLKALEWPTPFLLQCGIETALQSAFRLDSNPTRVWDLPARDRRRVFKLAGCVRSPSARTKRPRVAVLMERDQLGHARKIAETLRRGFMWRRVDALRGIPFPKRLGGSIVCQQFVEPDRSTNDSMPIHPGRHQQDETQESSASCRDRTTPCANAFRIENCWRNT